MPYVAVMATFLVEVYDGRTSPELVLGGNGVRWIGSFLIPEDEIRLHILEASSLAVVREVMAACGMDPDRIVEMAALTPPRMEQEQT